MDYRRLSPLLYIRVLFYHRSGQVTVVFWTRMLRNRLVALYLYSTMFLFVALSEKNRSRCKARASALFLEEAKSLRPRVGIYHSFFLTSPPPALPSALPIEQIAWCTLPKLNGTVDPDEESRAADCVDAVEEGVDLSSPRSTGGTDSVTTVGGDSVATADMTATRTTPSSSNGLLTLDEDTLSEPLLSVTEASPSKSK